MKHDGTVHKTLVSPGQFIEVQKTLLDGIPRYLWEETAQAIIGNKKAFLKGIKKVFSSFATPYEKKVAEWDEFYKKYFGIDIFESPILMSPKKEGLDRLLIRAKGLTPAKVAAVVSKYIPLDYEHLIPAKETWLKVMLHGAKEPVGGYTLDDSDIISDERPAESYGWWVQDQTGGADTDLVGQSAHDLKNKIIYSDYSFTTLMEEFLLMLKYFSEGKKYLEHTSAILCCGSFLYTGKNEKKVICLHYESEYEGAIVVDYTGFNNAHMNRASGRRIA